MSSNVPEMSYLSVCSYSGFPSPWHPLQWSPSRPPPPGSPCFKSTRIRIPRCPSRGSRTLRTYGSPLESPGKVKQEQPQVRLLRAVTRRKTRKRRERSSSRVRQTRWIAGKRWTLQMYHFLHVFVYDFSTVTQIPPLSFSSEVKLQSQVHKRKNKKLHLLVLLGMRRVQLEIYS